MSICLSVLFPALSTQACPNDDVMTQWREHAITAGYDERRIITWDNSTKNRLFTSLNADVVLMTVSKFQSEAKAMFATSVGSGAGSIGYAPSPLCPSVPKATSKKLYSFYSGNEKSGKYVTTLSPCPPTSLTAGAPNSAPSRLRSAFPPIYADVRCINDVASHSSGIEIL